MDVLRDVEPVRLPAERGADAEVGAVAGLVAGNVEAGRAAEPVGDDGVQVGRGRLVGGGHVGRRMPHVVITREYVNVPVGERAMRTFVAAPAAEGDWPGILFYTDIFQLTESSLRWAGRLAGYGFVVAVPEISHRVEPAGTVLEFDDEGRARGQGDADALSTAEFDADVAAALAWLGDRSGGP